MHMPHITANLARVRARCAHASCAQVVKADSATATVPELEFEIPAGTQRGTITTVEGLLREASDALRVLQPQRALHDPDTAAAVAAFLGVAIRSFCRKYRSSATSGLIHVVRRSFS